MLLENCPLVAMPANGCGILPLHGLFTCEYGVTAADGLCVGEADVPIGGTAAFCHQPQPLTVRTGTVRAAIILMALVIAQGKRATALRKAASLRGLPPRVHEYLLSWSK